MPPKQFFHHGDALRARNVGKADHPAVPRAAEEDQRAEIGIDGDQDPVLGGGPLENDGVAGVSSAFTRFDDVVSLLAQPGGEATARATIDEKPHFPATLTASSESCAITAWA